MSSLNRKLYDMLTAVGIKVNRIRERGSENFPSYVQEDFIKLYQKYSGVSMVPWQGMHDAYQAASYIAQHLDEGDVVECGVWRGGVSALMYETVSKYRDNPLKFWLFDTFEGMSDPTEHDFKSGRTFADTISKHKGLLRNDGGSNWCRGELDDVKDTMRLAAGSLENVEFVRGMVEETLFGASLPNKIALLRLDTDFYESTKTELEVLYPRLVKGGVLIIDDFGAWAGARKATQEYLEQISEGALCITYNHYYGALIGVKAR